MTRTVITHALSLAESNALPCQPAPGPITMRSAKITGRTAEWTQEFGTLIIFQGTAIIARMGIGADATPGEVWDMIHSAEVPATPLPTIPAPAVSAPVTLRKASDRPAPRGVVYMPSEYAEAERLERVAPRLAALTGHTEGLYANDHETLRSAFAILSR